VQREKWFALYQMIYTFIKRTVQTRWSSYNIKTHPYYSRLIIIMDMSWYYGMLMAYLEANELVEIHKKYDEYERQ